MLDIHQRQIYALSCGSGKSRVAATIALLLLELHANVKTIHIVHLNDVLQKKDREDYEDLWALLPQSERVKYHTGIHFAPGVNSVVIIDESDEHVFKDPAAFMKFSAKAQVICLTATYADD